MYPRILISAAIFSMSLASLQAQQPCQLTLVNEAGFNQASIKLKTSFGNDTESSTLTGTLNCTLDIDTTSNQSNQFTINSADINASNVTFSLLSGSVKLRGKLLKASAFTTTPPGIVTPSTGSFDATQHEFSVNSGNLTGAATVNLANAPLDGAGIGNGTLTLTHTGNTVTHASYNVTTVFDVEVSENITASGSTATVTIKDTTIKATGTCDVYFSPYLQWTEENSIPGGAFDATGLGKIPNGILWALGYDSSNLPTQLLVLAGGSITLPLPAGGTRSPSIIQSSTTLSDWAAIDDTKVSTGSSTIPAGSTGTITITPSGPSMFYRIKAVE